MQISTATHADIPELVDLVNSAYRGSNHEGWTTEADLLSGVRTNKSFLQQELSTPGHTVLCLRDPASRELLGCVALTEHSTAGQKYFHLGMLTIRPAKQNQNLGKHLLGAAEEFAISRGGERIVMNVIQVREELIAWYLRRGYRKTGEKIPLPEDSVRFPRLTNSELYFLTLEKLLEKNP